MAKKEVKNQEVKNETVDTTVQNEANVDVDTTFDKLKSGNLVSQTINEKALEEIAKSREESQIRDVKSAIEEAEYTNLKTVIVLRHQRRNSKVAKRLTVETKELLDAFAGTTNEKGEFVKGTMTKSEYEKKRDKVISDANRELREAKDIYNEELTELHDRFPNYWSFECGWNNVLFNFNMPR